MVAEEAVSVVLAPEQIFVVPLMDGVVFTQQVQYVTLLKVPEFTSIFTAPLGGVASQISAKLFIVPLLVLEVVTLIDPQPAPDPGPAMVPLFVKLVEFTFVPLPKLNVAELVKLTQLIVPTSLKVKVPPLFVKFPLIISGDLLLNITLFVKFPVTVILAELLLLKVPPLEVMPVQLVTVPLLVNVPPLLLIVLLQVIVLLLVSVPPLLPILLIVKAAPFVKVPPLMVSAFVIVVEALLVKEAFELLMLIELNVTLALLLKVQVPLNDNEPV